MKRLVFVLAIACSHEAKPAAPESPPPLPPSSGTPIGYLIDAASDLSLNDDQLAKLRTIDAKLTAELQVVDKQAATTPAPNPMGHHRGGHRHPHAGSDAPPIVDKDAAARTNNDRVTDVKAAIDEAFES